MKDKLYKEDILLDKDFKDNQGSNGGFAHEDDPYIQFASLGRVDEVMLQNVLYGISALDDNLEDISEEEIVYQGY